MTILLFGINRYDSVRCGVGWFDSVSVECVGCIVWWGLCLVCSWIPDAYSGRGFSQIAHTILALYLYLTCLIILFGY
jgi:hypothetical protein